MRSIVTLGVVSLVVAAGMVACGDDSSDDGPSLGGSGGTSSGAGGGGTGGAPGGSGGTGGTPSGGTGGTSGGTGGTGGAATVDCTGCLELQLPVVAGARELGFQFNFAAPAAPLDLSNSTITWKVQLLPADANANFFVQTYVANGPPEDPGYVYNNYANFTALTTANFAADAWVDIVHNVAALPAPGGSDAGADSGPEGDGGVATLTAFDKSVVRAVGIQIGAAMANTTTGTVRLLVDSVTITNATGAPAGTFTVDAEGLTANNYQMIPGVVPPTHH